LRIYNQTDFIAQHPIRNCLGDIITEIKHSEMNTYCSLLTWVEGRDLQQEDVSDGDYNGVCSDTRHINGIERNHHMLMQIQRGVELGLFLSSDFHIIEESFDLINSRLEVNGNAENPTGIIHGDLNMGNIIVSNNEEICFIDFGLFGFGYYLLDVSMGALMVQSELRRRFLEGYFGDNEIPEDIFVILEGFMLIAIFGYYAFHMENEAVHPWIRERMPLLCAKHCLPFLSGDSIFYKL